MFLHNSVLYILNCSSLPDASGSPPGSAAIGGKWDISNKQRIGFTEVQLVQKMIDGVKKLIALEQKLAKGEEITEADYA